MRVTVGRSGCRTGRDGTGQDKLISDLISAAFFRLMGCV